MTFADPSLSDDLIKDGTDASFNLVRDQAILELLYSSGLRLSELTSLDDGPRHAGRDGYRSVSWFDRDAAQVTVLGKGGKTRSVPVGRQAMTALKAVTMSSPEASSSSVRPTMQPP